jgi:hypothetical protein
MNGGRDGNLQAKFEEGQGQQVDLRLEGRVK